MCCIVNHLVKLHIIKSKLVVKYWINGDKGQTQNKTECSIPLTCLCECIPTGRKAHCCFFFFPFCFSLRTGRQRGERESEGVIELIMFYHLLAD